MSYFSTADFSLWNGGTGIYRPQAVADALVLAEVKAKGWLNTGLGPTVYTESIPWPSDWAQGNQFGQNNKIRLEKVRVISIDSVVGQWSDGTGVPQSDPLTAFTLINAKHGILRVIDPYRCWCSGLGRCPERIVITYTAGFTVLELAAGTDIGTTVRAIVFNATLGFLVGATGLNADGNIFKPNYSAAGFSESRVLPERSGAEELINEHIQMAFSLSRDLKVKRPPRLQ